MSSAGRKCSGWKKSPTRSRGRARSWSTWKPIGVNPVDTYIRSGGYGKRPLPYTPGSDAAGTVEAVGDGRHERHSRRPRLHGGDHHRGLCREELCAAAAQVRPLPERLSFAQGAGVYVPYYTAYYGLYRPGEGAAGRDRAGAWRERRRRAGRRADRAGGRADRHRHGGQRSAGGGWSAEQGAHHVLDHTQRRLSGRDQGADRRQGRRTSCWKCWRTSISRKDLGILAQNGRVVVIGSRGPIEIDPRHDHGQELPASWA